MLGLNLKFENCLIQSKLRIQRHIIAGVDSSAISSPNLEAFKYIFISLQSIVCERHCATSNFAAGHKYLGLKIVFTSLKSRLRTGLGCCLLSLAAINMESLSQRSPAPRYRVRQIRTWSEFKFLKYKLASSAGTKSAKRSLSHCSRHSDKVPKPSQKASLELAELWPCFQTLPLPLALYKVL